MALPKFLVKIVVIAKLVMFVTSLQEPIGYHDPAHQDSFAADYPNQAAVDGKPVSSNLFSFGRHRFLGDTLTCDHNPWLCLLTGTLGPNCCDKRCVNFMIDPFNCGECERKCKFTEICCQGKCSNLLTDSSNCGWCGHKCSKGKDCKFGLCGYA